MGLNEDRPVLSGLLALVGVGLAVGLIAGVSVLVGTHVLGFGGGKAPGGTPGAGQSMYLPKPGKTTAASGPAITLGSDPTTSSTPVTSPKSPSAKPRKRISLQAGEQSVSSMGRIDLTGTYPTGEGAILNVQVFSNGQWQGFYGVSATVVNGTFATYIQTGTTGLNRFRVIDSDTQRPSNEVRVQVR